MEQIVKEAFTISVIAFTYSVILTDSGEILEWLYRFLYDLANKNILEPCKQPEFRWWFKPVIDCEKCVAGQMSFWYYLFSHLSNYNLFEHITIVSFSIFVTAFIKLFYKWIQRH